MRFPPDDAIMSVINVSSAHPGRLTSLAICRILMVDNDFSFQVCTCLDLPYLLRAQFMSIFIQLHLLALLATGAKYVEYYYGILS